MKSTWLLLASLSILTDLAACGNSASTSRSPSIAPVLSTFQEPPNHPNLNFEGVYSEHITRVGSIDDCLVAIDFRGEPTASNPNLTNRSEEHTSELQSP